jgi:hypothetical protein
MARFFLEKGERELVIRERRFLIFILEPSLVDTRSATKDYNSTV